MSFLSFFSKRVGPKKAWAIKGTLKSSAIDLVVRADSVEEACAEARIRHPQIVLTEVREYAELNYFW